MRIIGAGLGRTGTNSLKLAVERLLGGPCYHMFELMQRPADAETWLALYNDEPADVEAMLDGWVGCVDWPGAGVFDKLAAIFPEAVVVLSVRDPDAWYESADRTIFPLVRARRDVDDRSAYDEMIATMIGRVTPDTSDRDATVAGFRRHNQWVRSTIDPARLVEWNPSDGWKALCDGLEVPIPDEPFPHANAAGQSFDATVRAAREGRVERGYDPG